MSNASLKDRLKQFDELIRQGQAQAVARALQQESKVRIPSELLPEFANLARRVGLSSLALRLLRPSMLRAADLGEPAPDRMVASYAASLAAIGANAEALSLLLPRAVSLSPDVQLYLGYVHLFRWEYAEAAPYFKRYLQLGGLTAYQRAIAKLNLAACLNFLDEFEALVPLLDELEADALKNGWHLLLRDASLIRAQMKIEIEALSDAGRILTGLEEHIEQHRLDGFLLRKWRAILELYERGPDKDARPGLLSVRAEAASRMNSEVLRDCDYHEALVGKKSLLMKKVYFGSNFRSYRARIESKTKAWFRPGESFRYALAGRPGPLFDLESGAFSLTETLEGELGLRLLQTLSGDLYRPLWGASLFAALYPGEPFVPEASIARVRQTLLRTRSELKRLKSPITISCHSNRYALAASAPADLRLLVHYGERKTEALFDGPIHQLRKAFPYREFSLQQSTAVLKQDASQSKLIIQAAEARGWLVRSGTGRGTLYRFK